MTAIAARFGVSGSYLTRVCTILNVPRPQRGHWAKLSVGKAPSPDPLPEARPGDQLYWFRNGELKPPPKPRQPPHARPEAPVRIPRSRVHPLIRGAMVHFESGRPVEGKACLAKALDLANDLFNALESVGHWVVIAPADEPLARADPDERASVKQQRSHFDYRALWSPGRPTVVYVGSVAIGLSIIETSKDVLLRYVRGSYIPDADYRPPARSSHINDATWTTTRALPSGELRVIAYSPYYRVGWSTHWQEATGASLRPMLKDIVRTIEKAACELVTKLEEADRKAESERLEWIAAQERRRREEDRRQIDQSVRDSREHLGQIIAQWSNVMSVEQFLVGVEKQSAGLPESERVEIMERLRLAREFLGAQDPLRFFRAWRTPDERYTPVYADETPLPSHDDEVACV